MASNGVRSSQAISTIRSISTSVNDWIFSDNFIQAKPTELSKSFVLMKMRKKSDLPTKICPVCNRPFAWRKKWERDWENVIYCSDACRAIGKHQKTTGQ
ncbi:DUF2256 domain-containing protein [Spirosoma agri]